MVDLQYPNINSSIFLVIEGTILEPFGNAEEEEFLIEEEEQDMELRMLMADINEEEILTDKESSSGSEIKVIDSEFSNLLNVGILCKAAKINVQNSHFSGLQQKSVFLFTANRNTEQTVILKNLTVE